jgi:hypothetical protein
LLRVSGFNPPRTMFSGTPAFSFTAAVFKPSPYSINASMSSHANTLTVTDSALGLQSHTLNKYGGTSAGSTCPP